jgi:hypothetical protein
VQHASCTRSLAPPIQSGIPTNDRWPSRLSSCRGQRAGASGRARGLCAVSQDLRPGRSRRRAPLQPSAFDRSDSHASLRLARREQALPIARRAPEPHTMRICIRRLTRLTNGFSKKWDNLRAALAQHFAWYNFCRKHITLKGATPAIGAGLTNRVWTIADLFG